MIIVLTNGMGVDSSYFEETARNEIQLMQQIDDNTAQDGNFDEFTPKLLVFTKRDWLFGYFVAKGVSYYDSIKLATKVVSEL